ncbi:unnamed protein product [Rangifer tarandus platyrhynchus]|uniref:Uncharacterized protein n=1 Tax=Rangifer tarandus platyrhynchus TaxID=3082113 RepID=A0ABN8ZD18_RANTA|nr:unnamed protein product [Rangifer tarandus platyrhynchus]
MCVLSRNCRKPSREGSGGVTGPSPGREGGWLCFPFQVSLMVLEMALWEDCTWPPENKTLSGYYVCGLTLGGLSDVTLPRKVCDVVAGFSFWRKLEADGLTESEMFSNDNGCFGEVHLCGM